MKLDSTIQSLAYKALEIIQAEFDNSVDPFWNPWTPLKRPTHKILIDTGNMKASFRISSIQEDRFEIANDTEYASFHQHGTKTIPKRQMLPEDGLPPKWADAFEEIIVNDLVKDLQGKVK